MATLEQDDPSNNVVSQSPSSIADAIFQQAARRGDAVAITYTDLIHSRDVTYSELYRGAFSVSLYLSANGLLRGQRALLLYEPGIEFLAAFLACAHIGVIAVPVYPPSTPMQVAAINVMYDACGATAILTTANLQGVVKAVFKEYRGNALAMMHLFTTDLTTVSSEPISQPNIDIDTVAMLQFTSGTTASPKGVVLTHRNLLSNIEMISEASDSGSESVFVGWLPQYHDMGLIGVILHGLVIGARSVIMSPTTFLLRPLSWLEAIDRYRGTHTAGPNFAYDLVLRRTSRNDHRSVDLSSLKCAINASERVRETTIRQFESAFKASGLKPNVIQPAYGLAEASVFVSMNRPGTQVTFHGAAGASESKNAIGPNKASSLLEEFGFVSCGRTWGDADVSIRHPDNQELVPIGTIGEIWIGGTNVSCGYWTEESTLGSRIRREDGRGQQPTGDLGFLHEGQLVVTGRIKEIIDVAGKKIYPQDVEWWLTRNSKSVRAGGIASFARVVNSLPSVGILAETTLDDSGDLSLLGNSLCALAKQVIPMIPFSLLIVPKGTIPKTSSGKIQRVASRQVFNELLVGNSYLFRFESPEIAAVAIRDIVRKHFEACGIRSTPEEVQHKTLKAMGLDSIVMVSLIQQLSSIGVQLSQEDISSRPLIELLQRGTNQ